MLQVGVLVIIVSPLSNGIAKLSAPHSFQRKLALQ